MCIIVSELCLTVEGAFEGFEFPELFTSHSFRATETTTFLENGGHLETAQNIAGHADSRTTKGYDRRATKLEMSEITRVRY
jgi:site-specific recombinase XerD